MHHHILSFTFELRRTESNITDYRNLFLANFGKKRNEIDFVYQSVNHQKFDLLKN